MDGRESYSLGNRGAVSSGSSGAVKGGRMSEWSRCHSVHSFVGAGILEAQFENFQNPKGVFMLAG
jgi:hypothetical protein